MKRLFALSLALCLLLSIAACGRDGVQNTDDPSPEPLDGMMDKAYIETCYPLPGGYKIRDVARLGNRLLILGMITEWDETLRWDITTDSVLALMEYTVSDTGRVSLGKVQVLPGNEDNAPVLFITAGGDGYFYALARTGEEDRDSQTIDYAILRYDEEGSQVDSMPVSLPSAGWNINDIIVTEDGTVVINSAYAVSIIRWQEGVAASLETDYWAYPSMTLTDNGVLLASYSGIYQLDTGTGEAVPTEMTYPDDDRSYLYSCECQGLDGEYLTLVTGEGFYEYNGGKDEWDLLLPYGKYDCGAACRLGEDDFLMCLEDTEALVLAGAERVPYEEDTRSVVKVAVLTPNVNQVSNIFDGYEDDPLYDYQVTTYDCNASDNPAYGDITTESVAQAVNRLRVEIIAGNTPDLLVCSGNYFNTDSHMFEDLYPYIDADEELNRDSFLPNLLDALSCNGELHQLWTNAQVWTLFARAADVGDGSGFTVSDYTRMVEENPAYGGVFDPAVTRTQLLYRVAAIGPRLFVDRENAEARFDDPAFAELLGWCMDMPEDEGGNAAWGLSGTLLMSYQLDMMLPSSSDFMLTTWGVGPDELVPVGYPDGGEGYSWYKSSLSMSIPAGGQNKEGAWAFIRDQISMDRQLARARGDGNLPVLYEALQREMEGRVASGKLEPEGRALTEETLRRTMYAETYNDTELQDIIFELGQVYLAGDRSLEDTVAQIQSRAKIYVAERYN